MSDAAQGGILLFVIIVSSLLTYFAPSIIAHVNGKRNKIAIFYLNALLGWTFIGWVVAIVWALTEDPKYTVTIYDYGDGKKRQVTEEEVIEDRKGEWRLK